MAEENNNPAVDFDQSGLSDETLIPVEQSALLMGYVLLKQGEPYGEFGNAHKEYLLLREDARSNIPLDGLAFGSLAHTPGYKKVYEYVGSWVLCGDDEDEP